MIIKKHNNLNLMGAKGFTLVELSIVIVIIGLLVGGVTAGSSLVHQSKLRGIATDVNKYKVAMDAFKLQYNSRPGDIRNATSYWPSASTVDGNGDRKIGWGGNASANESTRAWQHLSLAGVIDGSYAGTADPNGAVIGFNVPESPFSTCGYWFWHDYSKTQWLILGATSTPASSLQASCLTGGDANSLDKKIDDGNTGAGIMVATTGQNPAPSIGCDYTSPSTVIACYVWFSMGN